MTTTLAQVDNPSTPIEPGDLDWYLSNAWFRMGQTIFTTHILHYEKGFYNAMWLRIPLKEVIESTTYKKLKKNNAGFQSKVQPASLNASKEALFEKYKQAVSFEAAASLEHLLYGKEPSDSVYNTYEIVVYEGDRLIAVGFFDLGNKSAAGISCFYDPAYKKYSLGKYLIYQKIEYCQQLGMDYFYPGYFVPGHSAFDYKLEIARSSLQYYSLNKQTWLPLQEFSFLNTPLEIMRRKLLQLCDRMVSQNLPVMFFHYEFYNANLTPEFKGLDLFDFPVFLYCFAPVEGHVNPIVVYDVRDNQYHLVQCGSLFETETPIVEGENFATHLLKAWHFLYSTNNVEEMVSQLSSLSGETMKEKSTEKEQGR